MAKSVLYAVNHGVDASHLFETQRFFSRLKDAREFYAELKTDGDFKAKNLVRMTFPDKWSPWDTFKILYERSE